MKQSVSTKLRGVTSVFSCVSVLSAYFFSPAARAEELPQFRSDVVMQVALGHVDAGNYALRASITTLEPLGKIPFHVHQFGGIRYVLEGALTTNWKDGSSQTFTQGSTYFEGPGQNHPPGVVSANNPTDKPTKFLIIEWVPIN